MRFALVFVAACSSGDRRTVAARPLATPAPEAKAIDADPVPITPAFTSPHSSQIQLVATTDRGDAAITLDHDGGVRLWPVLDGKHEPVVVRAAPKQLAIDRDGDTLVAGLVDAAGGLEILRFDRTGNLLGRAKLVPEVDDVVVIGGHVIVRRPDQTLARFDAHGNARGELAAEPGQRIASLAARRGALAVGIGHADAATAVRFVDLGARLAWGRRFELGTPLVDLALAPGHRLVAGFAADKQAKIIALESPPKVVGTATPDLRVIRRRQNVVIPPPVIGFTDDSNAMMSGPELRWITAHADGAWIAAKSYVHAGTDTHAAIGDVVIGAANAKLILSEPSRERWLGYRKLGYDGSLVGSPITVRGNHEVFFLDAQLRETRALAADELADKFSSGHGQPQIWFALDDRHVLATQDRASGTSWKHHVMLYDIVAKKLVEIATLDQPIAHLAFDRGTRVIAFRDKHDIHRFKVDLANHTVTRLRTLDANKDMLYPIYLTNPALANGIAAVAVSMMEPGFVKLYYDSNETDGPPVQPRKLQILGLDVLAVDRAANIYTGTGSVQLQAAGSSSPTKTTRLPITHARAGSASSDGKVVAFMTQLDGGGVAAYDATGAERWRAAIPDVRLVAFSPDDRAVLVWAASGLLSFDAKTGERVAAVCGWAFGLYDQAVTDSVPNTASICVP